MTWEKPHTCNKKSPFQSNRTKYKKKCSNQLKNYHGGYIWMLMLMWSSTTAARSLRWDFGVNSLTHPENINTLSFMGVYLIVPEVHSKIKTHDMKYTRCSTRVLEVTFVVYKREVLQRLVLFDIIAGFYWNTPCTWSSVGRKWRHHLWQAKSLEINKGKIEVKLWKDTKAMHNFS
jgi:hypothetical protein